MVTMTTAEAERLKAEGNQLYKDKNYLKAAATYTQAIKVDKNNGVLYSNRSAALLQLNKVTKAISDAEECIRLRPEWEKGYFRKGNALETLKKTDEALECYKLAAEKNPDSKDCSNKVKQLTKVLTQKAKKFRFQQATEKK
jgi:tetratricopeptide (TPR) repeat protein